MDENLTPIYTHEGVKLTDKDEMQMYVFGGKGVFRLKSVKSNREFTYKIRPMSKRNPRYDEYTFYISLVVSGDTEFLGVLKSEENKYIHSKKSRHSWDSSEVKGIKWLLEQFTKNEEFPEGMEFYHMGICSCCGKTLTTPSSIQMGIGPVCFDKYGNQRLKKLLHIKKKIEQKMKAMGRVLSWV